MAQALRYAADALRERELPLRPGVRFLVDQNLSPLVETALRDVGHDAIHARDIGMARATDAALLDC